MAFWNRKRDEKKHTGPAVDSLTRVVVLLREEIGALSDEVIALRQEVAGQRGDQPVPTNGGPRAGGVQEWLPVLDRAHEIALVAMGHPDLAQAFGASSRQKEYRQAESQVETAWTEPDESTYENL
jgi:hypothetical protein